MAYNIIDGDWKEERHYKDYIIRAIRHGSKVEIWDLFPSTGGAYLKQTISYKKYLSIMDIKETLCNAFGGNY